jgi:aminotransferase
MTEISERELSLPELEFPRIFKRVINDESIVSLGHGEPDFVTPKPILNYAKKIISEGKGTHYSEPQGALNLREAIVGKLKKENKIKTTPDNVLITCGSQEALFAGLLTTIDPTEQVVIPSPGYLGYIPPVKLVNGVPVFLKLDEEDKFAINPDRLNKMISKKKTKVLIINSPGNPTGTVLSKKQLEEIADIAVDKDVYVFSDEAYEQIVYDDKKYISMGSLNGMQDHIVTFQTFSKSFAMCGFRLGYVAGPEKLIKGMVKVHHYITLTAPNISQEIGVKALNLDKKYINSMVREYKRRRDFIVKRLNDLNLGTPMPSGAFYAFSNIQNYKKIGKTSSKFSKQLLDKGRVAVIPGTEFGPYGEGYVRCSFAADYKLIEKAMNRIERFLK